MRIYKKWKNSVTAELTLTGHQRTTRLFAHFDKEKTKKPAMFIARKTQIPRSRLISNDTRLVTPEGSLANISIGLPFSKHLSSLFLDYSLYQTPCKVTFPRIFRHLCENFHMRLSTFQALNGSNDSLWKLVVLSCVTVKSRLSFPDNRNRNILISNWNFWGDIRANQKKKRTR